MPQNIEGESKVKISSIVYGYRNLTDKAANFGRSGGCNIDINCEEGKKWQSEKRSVVMILNSNNSRVCSGALINNVRQDCTPYLLTAEHCGVTASASDIGQWIFYFNYQASGCNNPASEGNLGNTFLTGATKKAQSNDNGGDTGSDFMLLELSASIPNNYNPYFAGWNAENTAATSGASIHHPQGDIKKISTYSTTLSTTSFGGVTPNTHWGVSWAASTNGHGVTESGSSGSPIFNQNKQIVGTLTGGASFCATPGGQDEYGKMSYHWNSNGTANNRRVDVWLDPVGNGSTTSLNGTYAPCSPSVARDAGITIINNPGAEICGNTFTPEVVLRNFGSSNLTSCQIVFGLANGAGFLVIA